jgi:hypothetical protein
MLEEFIEDIDLKQNNNSSVLTVLRQDGFLEWEASVSPGI